jgi:hypothetical protein
MRNFVIFKHLIYWCLNSANLALRGNPGLPFLNLASILSAGTNPKLPQSKLKPAQHKRITSQDI